MLSAQIGQCGQCRVIPANSRTQYKYANYVFNWRMLMFTTLKVERKYCQGIKRIYIYNAVSIAIMLHNNKYRIQRKAQVVFILECRMLYLHNINKTNYMKKNKRNWKKRENAKQAQVRTWFKLIYQYNKIKRKKHENYVNLCN